MKYKSKVNLSETMQVIIGDEYYSVIKEGDIINIKYDYPYSISTKKEYFYSYIDEYTEVNCDNFSCEYKKATFCLIFTMEDINKYFEKKK
jgi:signal peptidase I